MIEVVTRDGVRIEVDYDEATVIAQTIMLVIQSPPVQHVEYKVVPSAPSDPRVARLQ